MSRDAAERLGTVVEPTDTGRVARWAGDDELVARPGAHIGAKAISYQIGCDISGMHGQQIYPALTKCLGQLLTLTGGDYFDTVASFFLEHLADLLP